MTDLVEEQQNSEGRIKGKKDEKWFDVKSIKIDDEGIHMGA